MRRRNFLKLAAGAGAAGVLAPSIVKAQGSWPERPVKMIVPFAAGGATDLVARPWAEWLTKAFNQQFVVENRGGASGMIGAEAAAKSPPDGYTFFFSSNTATVTLPLLRKLSYDADSFQVVARMGDSVSGFVIHPSVGVKTFQDMIAYAKKNPGKLAFGSSGAGTLPHLRYEMLKIRTGVDILHVPYRGGADTLNDLLAGNIQLMNEGSSLPHVKAGKIHLLNVNHFERFAEFPDVPTLTELGVKDADVPAWFSLYAPAGTPKEIIQKLNAKAIEIAKAPETKARLQTVACVPVAQTIPEMQQYWEQDKKRTAELVKQAKIKFE
ncbi:MAG: tripartite tricarboxylate transporter substrate binding protein [Hyphomicrobiaceae bacterium]|nr:tripartite tricarboxylate transporter substrate binding protein [Hyphomicrobiaceae bacterium]